MKELSYLHEEGVTTDNLHISIVRYFALSYQLDPLKEKKLRVIIRLVLQLWELVQPIWTRQLVLEIRIIDLLDKEIFRERLERNLAERKIVNL